MRLNTMLAILALAGVIGLGSIAISPASEPKSNGPDTNATVKIDRPKRAPDYMGVIEKIKVYPASAPIGRPVVRVLVRTTGPAKKPDLIWVHLDEATLEQDGAHLEDGSGVSVWATGGVAKTDPPQAWATYILCQPVKQ
jgi:hypothetical protein